MREEDKRDDAMQRVHRHADPQWKAAAASAIVQAARELDTLTTQDVFDRIPPFYATHNYKAIGPLMKNAAVAGVIEKANEAPRQAVGRRHCGHLMVWRSLMKGK